ncbi:hypothetical protein GE061_015496 [Apolygus lucorum]|uniref:Amine oxidase domain-containing protein n=1 Tax=Apolygus lucorum TaxID=248454 RepID=A0A8S9XL86_APOLU|nr:hypothetical protein GE061_015496 [Apolygus lucorum]
MQKKSEKILWGMLNSLRVSFGEELSQISSAALADRGSSPGGAIILEGGMHRILSPLLQKIPEDKIVLNTPVHKITLDPCPEYHKPVKVITCDNKIFEADYVIVTVPLGVLKKRADDMFEGVLSKEQSNAIKNIGLGKLNHVYLEYAHPWWIPGMPSMSLAWGMEELQLSAEWTKGIGFIHEVHGSKHLLAVEIAGPEAELIEGVAEEEVAIQITRFLRKFTGDTSIPYPTNIVVTRWSCDPFFQGATVNMGVNTTPGMFKDLGGATCDIYRGPPVPPIIFAGDGTIPKYYGTMEGARRSGLRAANKIIASTKIKCEEEFREREEDRRKEEEEKCESSKEEAQQSCC